MAPVSPPVVALRPVANAQNEWVASLLQSSHGTHQVRAGALMEEGAARRLAELQETGYRVLLDHVEAALLRREGVLGRRLQLTASGRPDPAALAAAGVDGQAWWQGQLHAWHWAIQVARNV